MASEHGEPSGDAQAVASILNEELEQAGAPASSESSGGEEGPIPGLDLEAELAAILGESSDAGDDSSGSESSSGNGKAETQPEGDVAMTLDAVAERLGVDSGELYELEIPMPDEGESLTLGGLKDLATEHRRHELEREEWDAERERGRASLANAREELAAMFRLIPEQFRTPELLEQARGQLGALRDEQARNVLGRVPTWADETAKEADMAVMREHLEPFGLAGELDGVYHAGLLAYVRHNALREQRLEEALGKLRKRSSAAGDTGKRRRSSQRQQTRRSHSSAREARVAEVGSILSEST